MENMELRNKLYNSQSHHSMMMEQSIVNLLQKYKWDVSHSVYYRDSQTTKLRELDVVGRKQWQKKTTTSELIARLFLLIEVKSTSDYHIIISNDYLKANISSNYYWIGNDEDTKNAIINHLLKSGININNIPSLLEKFSKVAYPHDIMRMEKFHIGPISTEYLSSSFRETNIANEKDLDNSVVWRANLGLISMVSSLRDSNIKSIIDDINVITEIASINHANPEKDILNEYENRCRQIDIYHPIIITESKIWSSENNSISEINWCRLTHHIPHEYPAWWVDIVKLDHVDEYLNEITKHYEARFRKSKAKIIKQKY
jgi:hypothetical protein